MKEYEIWIEGYSSTGQHSDASLIGLSKGNTFHKAVENFRYPEDIIREFDKKIIINKGQPLALDDKKPDGTYYYGRPSIWACGLFDNEVDARKSFG